MSAGEQYQLNCQPIINVCPRSKDGRLHCPKCDKLLQDKAGLRKHLAYHTHRDKKYIYQFSHIDHNPNDI